MIVANITKDGEILMTRHFSDPERSLQSVLNELEAYVVGEQLNLGGECVLRARRTNSLVPQRTPSA